MEIKLKHAGELRKMADREKLSLTEKLLMRNVMKRLKTVTEYTAKHEGLFERRDAAFYQVDSDHRYKVDGPVNDRHVKIASLVCDEFEKAGYIINWDIGEYKNYWNNSEFAAIEFHIEWG